MMERRHIPTMADLTPEALAVKLRAGPFERAGPTVSAVSDPIADTPMVVTLDELRPYDLNPRVVRNPLYPEIKGSILSRGLDAPPPITRRPGERHYIIRNGGNTRLEILRELWGETKQERFYRIQCLFRPWSPRGEIVVLTGHLAENELHGGLTFIERALGVEKARELYEQESGAPLSQRELARRLTADGYPISQSHISRMQETVAHLLPAIPSILYAGLGRGLAERLTALRRDAAETWRRHPEQAPAESQFSELFRDVLVTFDDHPSAFAIERFRDELIGRMAQVLNCDYDSIALEVADCEMRARVLASQKPAVAETDRPDASSAPAAHHRREPSHKPTDTTPPPPARTRPAASPRVQTPDQQPTSKGAPGDETDDLAPEVSKRMNAHIVSPVESTPRLAAIQQTIAAATGEALERFENNVVRAIPVQAGGLYPISDVWFIEPSIDNPERLRLHIGQLAREIAHEAGIAHRIETCDDGIGYCCTPSERGGKAAATVRAAAPPFLTRAVLSLLSALAAPFQTGKPAVDVIRLADDLGPLLEGTLPLERSPRSTLRISDVALVKLFRLVRLARRLIDLESPTEPSTSAGS